MGKETTVKGKTSTALIPFGSDQLFVLWERRNLNPGLTFLKYGNEFNRDADCDMSSKLQVKEHHMRV